MLFNEMPMPKRFAAARDAGFEGVEIQFPDEDDMDALEAARSASGLPVVLVNIPRGGPDAAGLAGIPGRERAFADAVEVALRNAIRLGATKVNALAGIGHETNRAASRSTLIRNLRHAARVLDKAGLRLMVEPVNPWDVPGFLLTGLQAGLEVVEAVDDPNLALQFDFYHMARTEADLPSAVRRAGPAIGHVQFADSPGRGAPGSGRIDFAEAFAALRSAGYHGEVAAEYRPVGQTSATLGWMADVRGMIA